MAFWLFALVCSASLIFPQCSSAHPYAIAVRSGLTLNGSGIIVDSFDSSDPLWSNHGLYDPTKAKDGGDVASNGKLISAGNSKIFGHVSTGRDGIVFVGSLGVVGSHEWQSTHIGMIEPGWVTDDAQINFPITSLPYTNGLAPGPGCVVTVQTNFSALATNSSIYPDPSPSGGVTTNTVYFNVLTLPEPIPDGLVTNTTLATLYPLPSPLPAGTITTNTTTTTTPSHPANNTYGGSVTTNTTIAISSSYPAAGTYVDVILTNVTSTNTVSYPAPGTYLGSVTTNTTSTTSNNYPAPGTYVGAISTNLTPTTSGTYPAPGTYVGNVTTNFHLGHIIGYTYEKISFSYLKISGYTYEKTDYVYDKIVSFTYDKITSYTYTQIFYTYPVYTYSWTNYLVSVTYPSNCYDNVLYSGDYYASSLSGSTIVVGSARLVLPNGFNLGSSDRLTIAAGASLEIYAGGSSCVLTPTYITNQTLVAKNLIVYCAPTVNLLSLSTGGEFIGVVVAPQADLNINGGGNISYDLSGAWVVKSLTANGHARFHLDESLASLPLFPPTILAGPQNQSVLPGDDVTFSVSASGVGELTYQWFRFTFLPYFFPPPWYYAEPIPGETNSNLTLTNVDASDALYYGVIVSNPAGSSAGATEALLVVNFPPSITKPPTNQVVLIGSNVTFTVTAAGSHPLFPYLYGFQWKFNDEDIPNATLGSLTLTNVQLVDAGEYSVVVTNLAGSVTSEPATLSVYESAAATLNPSVDLLGDTFQFDVNGVPGFNYVIFDSTNLIDWTPFATNASPFSLIESNASQLPQHFYRAVYLP
jgi:hypothetical protein